MLVPAGTMWQMALSFQTSSIRTVCRADSSSQARGMARAQAQDDPRDVTTSQ